MTYTSKELWDAIHTLIGNNGWPVADYMLLSTVPMAIAHETCRRKFDLLAPVDIAKNMAYSLLMLAHWDCIKLGHYNFKEESFE